MVTVTSGAVTVRAYCRRRARHPEVRQCFGGKNARASPLASCRVVHRTKVVVTGATGFLGRNVVALLDPSVYEVHAITRRHEPAADEGVAVSWHQADVVVDPRLHGLLRDIRPEVLLHLAWLGGSGADRYASAENDLWADASLALIEEFGTAGGRRAVLAGSVVEWGSVAGTLREDTPAVPTSAYGSAKLALANAALAHSAVKVAVGRVFFAYGPHEDPNRLVPAVVRALLRAEPIALSSGAQIRDFLHAQDVANAFLGLLEVQTTGFVNIGSGIGISVRAVAGEIGRQLGREDLLQFGARPDGPDQAPIWVADNTLLRCATGWAPRFDLRTGLADCIQWWREHEPLGA